MNVGPRAKIFPQQQYECVADAALSTGTVFTLLANISQYKASPQNLTARLVRPMVEQYWLSFRSAYALFISTLSNSSPSSAATFSHQLTQSWYPNDINKLEAIYSFGHTEGKTLREAKLLGEWAFVSGWWLLATAGTRLFGNYTTNTFSLGLRHEF